MTFQHEMEKWKSRKNPIYYISNTKISLSHRVYLSPWEANKRSVSLVGSIWLTLLYYIRISLLSAEINVLFWWWMVDGGWVLATFWFFKSLDNTMVNSLGIYIFVHKRNRCRTKVLWVLKFEEVGDLTPWKSKSP